MAQTTRATGNTVIVADYVAQTLSNSTTETTVLTYAVAGGLLATNRGLRAIYRARLTTLLTPPTLTVRVKFGGTTVTAVNAVTLLASATNRSFSIDVKLVNRGAANSQYIVCTVKNPGSIPILSSMTVMEEVTATASVDTSTDQTFSITVQFGSSVSTTTLTTDLVETNIE